MQSSTNPFDFLDQPAGDMQSTPQSDLIKLLLYEIIRVKEIITYYESIPNDGGKLGASILNELVAEAYKSLVDYDTVLMKKYYDLLQTCD
jgi:hypothetical protein